MRVRADRRSLGPVDSVLLVIDLFHHHESRAPAAVKPQPIVVDKLWREAVTESEGTGAKYLVPQPGMLLYILDSGVRLAASILQ